MSVNQRACQQCHTSFDAYKETHRFCTVRCARRYQATHRVAIVTCHECRGEITTRSPHLPRYCARCRDVRYQAQQLYSRALEPWLHTYRSIRGRLRAQQGSYRHVISTLTPDDLRMLWMRDGAWAMRRPSIDRINTYGHYTLENCRYVELSENARIGAVVRELNRLLEIVAPTRELPTQ